MNTLNSDFETKLRTPSLLASDDESTMGWLVVHSDFESSEKYIQTFLNSNHSYLDPFKCLHSSIRFVDLIEFALLKRIEKLFYWEDLYKSLDNWTGTMTSFQVNLAITGHFFISFIFSKQLTVEVAPMTVFERWMPHAVSVSSVPLPRMY